MMSFYEFTRQFPDDEACLKRIMIERYGGTELDCPKCGEYGKFYRMTKERGYVCQRCGHHLHPTVGTPMERTHLPLHKWFYAMFLFSNSRHGVAAKELERQLDIPYKTAWRMAHEIRKYMAKVDGEDPLGGPGGGDVEADETYVGGHRPGKPGRGAKNKTVVFGMLKHGGVMMANVVPNVAKRTLYPIITENIVSGSTVYTDEFGTYRGLGREGYTHKAVSHKLGEYVNGDCHVIGLEGFWARLKLSIRGTHVHVSRKHLQKYVKEFEYRYNRRTRPAEIFGDLVACL